MKTALLLLCLFSTSIQSVFPNDQLINEVTGARKSGNIQALEGNNFLVQNASLIFDDDEGIFLFGNDTGSILFQIEEIDRLKQLLEKYLSWEKLAVSNKVKVFKDIPESVFTTEIVYNKTTRGAYVKEDIHFKMAFYSASEIEHFLVIDGGWNERNIYSFLGEPFYIKQSEVVKLYNSIKEEEIEPYIQVYRNKEKAKDLFK